MKILIVYFSQTGNTLKVAKAISEEFLHYNHNVKCISVNQSMPKDFCKYDIIGFGSPTFESHAPTPIKRLIKSLPDLTGKNSFIFTTSAGASGNVISDMIRLLKKKNLNIIDTFLVPGEMFHPAPCIKGKSYGRPNAKDLKNAKKFALNIIGMSNSKHCIQYYGIKPKKGFYNIVGKITSSEKLIRLLVPKPKLDINKCNNCQKCNSLCPMDNITNSLHPVLSNKCIRCYHCMNSCSNKAYSVNWWFGNIVILLFWNKYFMSWFGEYEKDK